MNPLKEIATELAYKVIEKDFDKLVAAEASIPSDWTDDQKENCTNLLAAYRATYLAAKALVAVNEIPMAFGLMGLVAISKSGHKDEGRLMKKATTAIVRCAAEADGASEKALASLDEDIHKEFSDVTA